MNLLLLEPGELAADGTACLSGRRAAHVSSVLRATAGDEIAVGELGGRTGRGLVLVAGPAELRLAVTLPDPPPAPLAIDVLLALPRPKTLRRLLRALTSMGVKRILLVNAARVEKSYFDSPALSPESLAADLREGLEQGKDTVLPEVTVHPLFRPFVEDQLPQLWPASFRKWLAHPALEPTRVEVANGEPQVLAIGPDGGWVTFELELLAAQGFRRWSLGPRPLRVDVAAIASLARLDAAGRERLPGAGTAHRASTP